MAYPRAVDARSMADTTTTSSGLGRRAPPFRANRRSDGEEAALIARGAQCTARGGQVRRCQPLGKLRPRASTPGLIAGAWTPRQRAVDGAIVEFRCPDQIDPILAAAKLDLSDEGPDQIGGAT